MSYDKKKQFKRQRDISFQKKTKTNIGQNNKTPRKNEKGSLNNKIKNTNTNTNTHKNKHKHTQTQTQTRTHQTNANQLSYF